MYMPLALKTVDDACLIQVTSRFFLYTLLLSVTIRAAMQVIRQS